MDKKQEYTDPESEFFVLSLEKSIMSGPDPVYGFTVTGNAGDELEETEEYSYFF